MKSATIILALVSLTAAKIVFKEEFDDSWRDRWIDSTHKSDFGKWEHTAGKFYGDAKKDKGIKTSQDAHFYATSAKFAAPFSNEGKTLVVQFSVKHEQNIDCGGGYVKVMPSTSDLKDFHGETPYNIMFGPDICGYSSKKVHVIFNHKGKNLLTKKEIKCKDDVLSHLYTLVVKPDNTYEVYIDQERVEGGNLEDDWDFLAPKKIKDPAAKKPEDWDDREEIDDPEDTKPADYDKPQYIPDPNAKKPEDWDDEMDGAWEPPQIDNPEFKGEWKPKKIKNPKYSGVWVHPEIDNPEYVPDNSLYRYADFGAIGFDLWQVKSGTIFDNVLVAVGEGTEAIDEARVHGKETWGAGRDNEKKMKEELDKKEEEEKKKREEEEKKHREEEDAKKKEDDADKADAEKAEEESEHAHGHDHDHGEL